MIIWKIQSIWKEVVVVSCKLANVTVKVTAEKPSVGEPVILPVGLSFKPSGNTGSTDTIEISSEHVGTSDTVKPTPVCIFVDV